MIKKKQKLMKIMTFVFFKYLMLGSCSRSSSSRRRHARTTRAGLPSIAILARFARVVTLGHPLENWNDGQDDDGDQGKSVHPWELGRLEVFFHFFSLKKRME
jgi:hypothetical protein